MLVEAMASQPFNIDIAQNEMLLPEGAEFECVQIRDAGNANGANGARSANPVFDMQAVNLAGDRAGL